MTRRVVLTLLLLIRTGEAAAQADTLRRSSVRTFEAVAAAVGHPYKGEFETTTAFQERLRARLDTSLIVLEVDVSSVSVKYDADSGRFSIYPTMWILDAGPPAVSYPAVTTREVSMVKGTHRASNAFGATVEVVDKVGGRWTVASTIPDVGFRSVVSHVAAPPAAARALKPSLRFFVSGHLTIGPSGEASALILSVDTATLSSPVQEKTAVHVLWMEGPEFDVVDARTHKILARVGY